MEETSIVRLEAWRLLHAEEGLPYLRQALPLTDWEADWTCWPMRSPNGTSLLGWS